MLQPLLLLATPIDIPTDVGLAIPNSTSVSLDLSGRQTRQLLEAFDGCSAIPARMCKMLRLRDPDIAAVCCAPEVTGFALFWRNFLFVFTLITGVITFGWFLYGLSGLDVRGVPLPEWILRQATRFGGLVHDAVCAFGRAFRSKFCAGVPSYEDERIADENAVANLADQSSDNSSSTVTPGTSGPSAPPLVTDVDAPPTTDIGQASSLRRRVIPVNPPAVSEPENNEASETSPLVQPLPKSDVVSVSKTIGGDAGGDGDSKKD